MASDNGQSDAPAPQVDEDKGSDSATPTSPPPPPIPSADPKLVLQARTPPPLHTAPSPSSHDLFKLSPIAALKLLGASIEALVRVTGDIPPTPPPTSPTIPNMRSMQREKAEIVRTLSEKSLVRLREQAEAQAQARAQARIQNPGQAIPNQSIDGVHLKKASTLESLKSTPEPYIIIGANSQPLNLQHSAITRKFFSKQPPPISIEDYLLRIHRFCPMSTAVYLATSFYIYRLAVEERAIAVTRRNCHRLLLAGLRVAMKALEDLSYPHAKIARVGGVSEIELARLEISFCFLTSFELVIGEDTLKSHWETLKQGRGLVGFELAQSEDDAIPTLKLDAPPKKGGIWIE